MVFRLPGRFHFKHGRMERIRLSFQRQTLDAFRPNSHMAKDDFSRKLAPTNMQTTVPACNAGTVYVRTLSGETVMFANRTWTLPRRKLCARGKRDAFISSKNRSIRSDLDPKSLPRHSRSVRRANARSVETIYM